MEEAERAARQVLLQGVREQALEQEAVEEEMVELEEPGALEFLILQ